MAAAIGFAGARMSRPLETEARSFRLSAHSTLCSGRRVMAIFDQACSFFRAFVTVESQDASGDFADVGQRVDCRSVQCEMVSPPINARIEEAHQLFCRPVDRTEVAAFVAVAALAGLGEVFRCCRAKMFDTDNVIYLAAEESVVEVNHAIFAEIFSAAENELPQFFADVTAHEFINWRARILAIRMTCSSHM